MSGENAKIPLKTYICGCIRNCAPHLPRAFANLEKIAKLFDDYQIVIAFDQSNDYSLRVLCDIKKSLSKMDILINRLPRTNIRTQNIANARNSILRYIRRDREENADHADFAYFIMMDFDDVCSGTMDLNVLNRYLEKERRATPLAWDSLSFNRPGYYDAWALSIEPFVFSCWHFMNAQDIIKRMRAYVEQRLENTAKRGPDELLACMSAFNGFAIYRIAKFDNISYEWQTAKNLEIIPRELVKNSEIAVSQKICQRRNDDDCEHRYFHIRARQVHGARICISPQCLFTDIIDCP